MVFFVHFQLFAQRERLQIFSAEEIEEIIINADEIFKVQIEAASTKEIQLYTLSEGEYFNDIGVNVQQTLNTFKITTAYKEILTSGFDKLSAHKLYAVNLKLVIPENLKVTITSNIASIHAKGDFEFLEAELKSGECDLRNYTGKAIINTLWGNVYIETKRANVEAKTHHGSLKIAKNLTFGPLVKVKSIYGNIEVIKIQ